MAVLLFVFVVLLVFTLVTTMPRPGERCRPGLLVAVAPPGLGGLHDFIRLIFLTICLLLCASEYAL